MVDSSKYQKDFIIKYSVSYKKLFKLFLLITFSISSFANEEDDSESNNKISVTLNKSRKSNLDEPMIEKKLKLSQPLSPSKNEGEHDNNFKNVNKKQFAVLSQDEQDTIKPKISQNVRYLSQPQISLLSPYKNEYDQFLKIMKLGSHPITIPIEKITAEDEDKEGSRKWVKFFNSSKENKDHEWHCNMSKVIKSLRYLNSQRKYLPTHTNFAVARLTFIFNESEPEVREIPFFFISGWPANKNRESIGTFSQLLSEGKIGEDLIPYKHYGLSFVASSYNCGEEKDQKFIRYDSFKDKIKNVINEELNKREESILGDVRLKSHIKLLSDNEIGQDKSIFSMLYLHSEQAIWLYMKDEIEKFKIELDKKNIQVQCIQHIFADICSFYDMCWCCGDTFVSCSHTKQLGTKVFIRASGSSQYYDKPFEVKPPYALRDHKNKFSGYQTGKAFELLPHLPYKPYIAHATVEDLK